MPKEINGKLVAELTVKFRDPKTLITAKDARAMMDASGKDSMDEVTDQAWEGVQSAIKAAVLEGRGVADINLAMHHNPVVKAEIEKRLDKAGFRYLIQGNVGYIYW